jgi:thiamine pyrophosphate-dependent acetolactate synthase large subunit-like protein
MYPVSPDFRKVSGLTPDLLFLVGCQGVHGSVSEPLVMQIGPNPLLMGRHYPLDLAAQCELKGTLHDLGQALTRLHGSERATTWARQRAKVRAYAALLIEREHDLVREHEHDTIVHPSVLEAQLAELLPSQTMMVQESSTARTTLMALGHQGMGWTRSGGGSLGWGVGGAIGAKIAVGRDRPVVLHLGDGALTYSAAGFWTMARYNTAVLTIVSITRATRSSATTGRARFRIARWSATDAIRAFIWEHPPLTTLPSPVRRAWTAKPSRP